MQRGGWRLLFILAGGLLAGCSYEPALQSAPKPGYSADLGACRETAEKAADRRVITRGYLYFSYPVSYPLIERAELRKCLESKGYVLG